MSRTISLTFRGAMYDPQTEEIPIVLITIEHDDIEGALRLSSDPTERLSDTPLQYGTVSNGDTYLFCPMSISLPDDMDERAPTARFAIENVSRELIAFARSVTTPGTCSIQIVLASSPDDVEIEYPEMDLRSVQFSATMLTLEMGIDSLDQEPFPAGTFNPVWFPGLFS
jgi:hypothetical protein